MILAAKIQGIVISRHIPMRNVKKSSFVELAKYLQTRKANRSAWALLRLPAVIRAILDAAHMI